jgi:hypothetical protein
VYFNYPTGSHTEPTAVASDTTAGTAVDAQPLDQGPADVTLAGGLSPYGVMGLGGNVWEWEETELDFVNDVVSRVHGVRGGYWASQPLSHPLQKYDDLSAGSRDIGVGPSWELRDVGFRVTSLPEPSSIWLAALGMIGLMMRRRRSH